MNFLGLQNAVLSDRFSEAQRASSKDWINARYGRVWAKETWPFKTTVFTTTLPLNTNSLSLTTLGLQRIEQIYDSGYGNYNVGLAADRPEDFYKYTSTAAGNVLSFTTMGNNIIFDRPASSTRSITIVGETKWVPLVADADVPALPAEFHFMLVHGAASEGLRLENDPTWKDFEDDFQRYEGDLRASYLTQVRTYGDAYPAFMV